MQNPLWSALTVGLAALLGWLALSCYRRGEPQTAAAAIVGAGMALRLFAGTDLFLHAWDERYHALVAKNLIGHPLVPALYDHPALPYDYRDWHANHVWLHKPPLAMWLAAGSMALLGVDELALRLPSLVLSGLAIFFTYVIGRHLFGPAIGLLGAGFHAINGYLLQLPGGRAPVDHVDNDLTFFVELGVFLSVLYVRSGRRWLLGAIGAAAGLAVLTKWLPGLIIYPIWLALVWGRQKPCAIAGQLAAMALITAAIALPWQLYIHRAFPLEAAWESAYNVRHLSEPIEGLGGSPLFYLLHMPRYFGELVWLPVAAFTIAWAGGGRQGEEKEERKQERKRMRPIAVWWLVPYAVFSFAATKMGAYVMTAAPALCIIQAWFWVRLAEARPRAGWVRGLRWAALVLLVALPLRYSLERLKLGRDYDRDPPWVRELRQLPGRVGTGQVALFNVERPVEAMFYTPYTAYSGLPTAGEAHAMLRAGWRVVLLDWGDVPERLRFPGVELLDNRGHFRDLGALNDH